MRKFDFPAVELTNYDFPHTDDSRVFWFAARIWKKNPLKMSFIKKYFKYFLSAVIYTMMFLLFFDFFLHILYFLTKLLLI